MSSANSIIRAFLGGTVEDVIRIFENSSWNWDEFIASAASEYVLPTLCALLDQAEVAVQLPTDIAEFVAMVRKLSLERNEAMLSEAGTVAQVLNSVGVEPILLKGIAYLAADVYGDLSARFVGDIDFLVPASSLALSVEVLRNSGYAPVTPQSMMVGHHYPRLFGPRKVGIELHHRLSSGVCDSILPASDVLRDSAPFRLAGARVRMPSAEHLVTHHIMHSQIHERYCERIWPSLRAMYDLIALRNSFGPSLNWAEIEHRFRRNRRYGVLAAHLLLVSHVLGIKRPFPIRMKPLLRLRWIHRMLLRNLPGLRRIDPLYWFSSVVPPRTRLLRDILSAPQGWRYLLGTPLRGSFYRHVIENVEHRRQ